MCLLISFDICLICLCTNQLKRKIGVKGTAGSTPAPSSKIISRRDSSVFNATPLSALTSKPSSRPPSVLSEADSISTGPRKERVSTGETQTISARVSALGKSTRVNTMGGASASVAKSVSGRASTDSSMGPPSLKPRQSVATPTPAGRVSSLTRSFSANKIGTPQSVTPMPHRRVASVEQQQTPSQKARMGRVSVTASPAPSSVAEVDEKENVATTSPPVRKRAMIPVPA